jgi:hypothetical protein
MFDDIFILLIKEGGDGRFRGLRKEIYNNDKLRFYGC